MDTTPRHHSRFLRVAPLRSKMRNGMEEVAGSIPTRSTKNLPMTTVYILQSESTRRFYIGCAGDVSVRLAEHQRGQTISTRGRGALGFGTSGALRDVS